MEEIEVGEYLRIYGILGKITKKENDNWYKWKKQGNIYNSNIKIDECRKVKHRKQLIDLIEVRDIVRIRTGLYSSFMEFIDNEECLLILKEQVKKFWAIEEILTKEQMEANCYKVGGEDGN